jgi:putative oxidoreductase
MKYRLPENKDAGLLVLRILSGAFMLFGHGLSKLKAFGEKFHTFSDPLGVGHETSYLLTVFSEFFCSILLIVGLFTRFASVTLIITMLIAAFVIHSDDPWNKQEFALLYVIPCLALIISGPGKYSLDRKIRCTKS